MFTTGSRFFFGLSVLGVIGALAYGFNSEWEPFGLVVLSSVALGLVLPGLHDPSPTATPSVPVSVGASSAADAEGEYGTERPVSPSGWPLVGRLRLSLTAIGLVTERFVFLAGIFAARRGDDRVDGAGVVRPGVRRPGLQPVAPRPGAAAGRVPALRPPRWRRHRARVLPRPALDLEGRRGHRLHHLRRGAAARGHRLLDEPGAGRRLRRGRCCSSSASR